MDENLIQEIITKTNETEIKLRSIGIIYEIIGEDTHNSYIGKTTTSLRTRSKGHMQSFINFKKEPSKRWCKSTFVIEQNKSCKMIILFIIPIYYDEDEITLLEKEKEFILNINCVNRYKEEIKEEFEEEIEEEIEEDYSVVINIPIEIGIIYKIYDDLGIYIGSTKGPLSYRINSHIHSALIYNTLKSIRICSSHEIILRNNYQIEVIEFVIVKTKDDLLIKERIWIENTDCVNNIIPIRSVDESKKYHLEYYELHKNDPNFIATYKRYKNDHEERIKQYQLNYRCTHREERQHYDKERHQNQKSNPIYLQKRKENKSKWNHSTKGQQSINEYNNLPEVKEHRKQLYLMKKETKTEEEIQHIKQISKQWRSQQVICCGTEMSRSSLSTHIKTKKHIKNNPV